MTIDYSDHRQAAAKILEDTAWIAPEDHEAQIEKIVITLENVATAARAVYEHEKANRPAILELARTLYREVEEKPHKGVTYIADFIEAIGLKRDLEAPAPAPVPLILSCPSCDVRHIDRGPFATRPHHTHACQACGHTWRPSTLPTVGVAFLPGFHDADTYVGKALVALARSHGIELPGRYTVDDLRAEIRRRAELELTDEIENPIREVPSRTATVRDPSSGDVYNVQTTEPVLPNEKKVAELRGTARAVPGAFYAKLAAVGAIPHDAEDPGLKLVEIETTDDGNTALTFKRGAHSVTLFGVYVRAMRVEGNATTRRVVRVVLSVDALEGDPGVLEITQRRDRRELAITVDDITITPGDFGTTADFDKLATWAEKTLNDELKRELACEHNKIEPIGDGSFGRCVACGDDTFPLGLSSFMATDAEIANAEAEAAITKLRGLEKRIAFASKGVRDILYILEGRGLA